MLITRYHKILWTITIKRKRPCVIILIFFIRIKINKKKKQNVSTCQISNDNMPLPPALAKKLATRGILTENEGKRNKYIIMNDVH